MKYKNSFSRRDFMKSSALASTAVVGAAAFSGCAGEANVKQYPLRQFLGAADQPIEGISGLLFSQVGYELGLPVKIVLRLPQKEMLSEAATCQIVEKSTGKVIKKPCTYWGEVWGSHWWVMEFWDIQQAGIWDIEVLDGGKVVYADEGLKTAKGVLWDETIKFASVDMLERRAHFTKVGAGWQDAGTLWVESPAQSGMIISLEDLLEKSADRFDQAFIERLEKQITVGCDYLVMTQKKAKELGYAEGAFTHDLHGHEHDILPNDANKAVVALMRAYRLLSDKYSEKKEIYREAAEKAYQWLVTDAQPLGSHGYEKFQRGLPADAAIPKDEWVTRDLVMMCWAALEKWKVDQAESTKQKCVEYAQQTIDRQISKDSAMMGFYGNFKEFGSMAHSESSWVHGIVLGAKGSEFGTDMGGYYPNYLMPVIEMLKLWPDHESAPAWRRMLVDFTEGYLKPHAMPIRSTWCLWLFSKTKALSGSVVHSMARMPSMDSPPL